MEAFDLLPPLLYPNVYSSAALTLRLTLHKKWSFSIRVSLVDVTKICRKLRIRSYFLKKSSKENFIFCAVLEYLLFLEEKIKQFNTIFRFQVSLYMMASYFSWCGYNYHFTNLVNQDVIVFRNSQVRNKLK